MNYNIALRKSLKNFLKKSLLFIGIIILLFLLFEIYFRLFFSELYVDPYELLYKQNNRTDIMKIDLLDDELDSIDKNMTWYGRTNIYILGVGNLTSNNTFRILNVGDSVTAGGCPNDRYLELLLNKRFEYNFDVINAGVGGADSQYLTHVFTNAKEIVNPDVVTLLTGWNDHWYESPTPCELNGCYDLFGKNMLEVLNKKSFLKSFKSFKYYKETFDNFILFRLRDKCKRMLIENTDTFIQNINHSDTSIYRIPLDNYKENLINFVDIARNDGIEVILITPPSGLVDGIIPEVSQTSCTLIDKEMYYDIHEMYLNTIRTVAFEKNVYLIDLDIEFKNNPKRFSLFENVSSDPIHPNINGNLFCSNVFYNSLVSFFNESLIKLN